MPHNNEDVGHAYKSKFNMTREHQAILLMITDDGENWHYLCVKKTICIIKAIKLKS